MCYDALSAICLPIHTCIIMDYQPPLHINAGLSVHLYTVHYEPDMHCVIQRPSNVH